MSFGRIFRYSCRSSLSRRITVVSGVFAVFFVFIFICSMRLEQPRLHRFSSRDAPLALMHPLLFEFEVHPVGDRCEVHDRALIPTEIPVKRRGMISPPWILYREAPHGRLDTVGSKESDATVSVL